MTLLFDISPDEPAKKKSPRSQSRGSLPEPKEESLKTPFLYREIAGRLGTIDDDTYACNHPACYAGAHDILLEDGKEWLIACAFCGSMQWVKAIADHLKPKPEEFRFRDGLFAGMTPAEAASEPRGLDYLSWAAENHPRPAVRDAVKKHLDGIGKGL
jgi:hypothetical protein